MGTLFNCSWEAGPPRGMKSSEADYKFMFIAQDCYEGVSGSAGDAIRDVEDGDTVPGNGRYGMHHADAGLSDPSNAIASSSKSRTGDTIWWFLRFQYNGFGSAPDSSSDRYLVGTIGVEDLDTGTGNPDYLTVVLEVQSNANATPDVKVVVERFNSDFTNDTVLITSSSTYSSGDNLVVVVEYTHSTGAIELFVNDTSEGTATNSLNASSAKGYVIPTNQLVGTKSNDQGLQLVYGHLYSNDSDSSTGLPATRPTTSLQAINYFPNANGSNTAWTGDFEDVDDESGTVADANVIEPSSANDKETFTFEDANGTSHSVMAVQVVYLYQKSSGGAGSNHEVYASIGGSDWQTETPYEGDEFSADITGTATAKAWHWTAHLFQQTPESTPADWSITDFDALEAGLNAVETTDGQREVHEYNVIAVGNNLERPGVTPPAAGDARSFAVVIG